MTHPLVSIDPYKRTKIFYAAGFVVSGMTIMFLVFSSKTMGLNTANILMMMSLLFFALGAFLYWRAGKIFGAGEIKMGDTEISIQKTVGPQTLFTSGIRMVQLKDEGFQKFERKNGKVFTCTFISADGLDKQRLQVFFAGEENLRTFLSPLKAAGIEIVQH